MASISRSSTPRGTRARAAQTQVQVEPAPSTTINATRSAQPVLHLRGATREEEAETEASGSGDEKSKRRIQWAESVVDNDGLGRKSSKVCCIYHAPRGIDESSDESSSDSDDSDSASGDDGAAKPARRNGCRSHKHNHEGQGKGNGKGRARSPNAYEKLPRAKSSDIQEKS